MPHEDLLDGLNPAQLEAVTHDDGPAARRRRSRLGQDAGAHPPHRPPDRGPRASRRSRSSPSPSPTRPPDEMQRARRRAGRPGGAQDVGLDLPLGLRSDPPPRRPPARLSRQRSRSTTRPTPCGFTYVLRDLDIDPKRFPPRSVHAAIWRPRTRAPRSRSTPTRPRSSIERRIADVFTEYQTRLLHAGRHGLRRPVGRHGRAALTPSPRCSSTTSTASPCARRRVPGHQPGAERAGAAAGRGAPQRLRRGRHRPVASTRSAAPTSATSWSSSTPSPTPPSSCWSRTTAPPRPSSTPPTRSSPTTWLASPRSCGPSPAAATRSSASTRDDESDEAQWVAARDRARSTTAGDLPLGRRRGLLPHQRAVPRRSRSSSCGRASRTRSSAAPGSTTAARSRTRWPT